MDTNSYQTDKKDSNKVPGFLGQKLSHEAVFMNMSKKAEKISTALYMVTDLISANDPIRNRIRECGVDLKPGRCPTLFLEIYILLSLGR